MGNFTGTNGSDTYGRSYTAAAARTLLNVANGATNVTNTNQLTNGAGYTTYTSNQATNTNSTVTFTTVNAGTFNTTSDERAKKDIRLIENALDKVQQLGGYSFTLKATDQKSSGVIAQEVQKVMPELVQEGGEGHLTVQYGNMVGLLIEAIKEQQAQIDALTAKING
jgi:Flp pilus assembly protein TadG